MSVSPLVLVNLVLVWLAIAVLFFLTVGLARRQRRPVTLSTDEPVSQMLKPGEAAPTYAAKLLDGEPVTSASFSGTNVVYVFFGPHCGPCREKMPELEAARERYSALGIEMVIVSTGEEAESHAYFRKHPTPFPVLIAPRRENRFMADYRVPGTPTYVFVKANGEVAISGLLTGEVEELLSDWAALLRNADLPAGLAAAQ